MSTAFDNLLAATIDHLQALKEQGSRMICVSPAVLQELRKPLPARPVPHDSASVAGPSRLSSSELPKSEVSVSRSQIPQNPIKDESSGVLRTGPATESKPSEMEKLRQCVLGCVKCPHLVAARKKVVFGIGDIHAKLMFVGEAPGADEDAQGEPFVGAAGQLLTRIITTMGLSRQTVYIANILKCRPDTPGQQFGNRKPTADEMKTCLPWLEKQIELIQPQVMVALGVTAVEGLLGSCPGISKMRGHWQTYRNLPLMPTFHPSYLLHNAALSIKRQVWEDMLQVMTKLCMPISAKQQNYFLKGA